MVAKQNQFDAMTDDISRVFMGDIRNFYCDDFPSPANAQQQNELTQALGDAV